jgi:FkbM family methyltransferase
MCVIRTTIREMIEMGSSALLRVASQSLGPASRLLCRTSAAIVRSSKNYNYDMRTNGEEELLRRLRGKLAVIFDVGANRGDWTAKALEYHPTARIHAFEIAPASFALLKDFGDRHATVIANPIGLADKPGTVTLNVSAVNSTISSMVAGPEIHLDIPWTTQSGTVTTGDLYCRERGITAIDLLKIDVEGAEHLVLKGFADMLTAASIRIIQFEYGMTNIYSHFLLIDFYRLLEGHGYVIGKIMPNGVAFKSYAPQDEDFLGPNYLAVKRDGAFGGFFGLAGPITV